MANTTNTQQTKGQETAKVLKANVLDFARELQQTLSNIKRQASALSEAIHKRKQDFVQTEEISVDINVVEEQEQTTVVEQPAPVTEAESVTAEATDVAPETCDEQPIEQAAEEVASAPEKPKTKIVTTIENGRKVETYTDEKGNVKVRKFLDLTAAAKRPTAPQGGVKRDQRGGAQTRTDTRRVASGGKDDNATDRRSPSNKPAPKKFAPVMDIPRNDPQKSHGNKNKTKDHPDEKKTAGYKKTLLTRDFSADYDEDRVVRRARSKKSDNSASVVAPKITHAVITVKEVPIKLLSERIGISASEIIKQLFKEGIMKTINDSVDFDYAEYIAGLHGVTLELKVEKTAEEIISYPMSFPSS